MARTRNLPTDTDVPDEETPLHIPTADGRQLAYDISGDPAGRPVFLLHGTPGSRSGPRPRHSVLYRMGIRLISYNRPGYGTSSRRPGRRVADAAEDVQTIADYLGIKRFAVVGRSGGGPHALACAALLAQRVVRTAVLVGLAPPNAPGLDWFDGMTDGNVNDFSAATHDAPEFAERLRAQAEETRADPHSFLRQLDPQMTDVDRHAVRGAPIRVQLADAYADGLGNGPDGWEDDVIALRSDWGFAFESITGPVLFWHGAQDNFAPAQHALWLAAQIPGARILVQERTAHFGAIRVLPTILAWLSQPPHQGGLAAAA